MAFAGIFQPFARLRWIRFGLLMRDRKFSRRFSVPQTTALAPLSSANRTITRMLNGLSRMLEFRRDLLFLNFFNF